MNALTKNVQNTCVLHRWYFIYFKIIETLEKYIKIYYTLFIEINK